MRRAGFLAFNSGALERRAELRDCPERLAELWFTARILPLWRGKPLMGPMGESSRSLRALNGADPLAADRFQRAAYLGQQGDEHWFAFDMSDWVPEGDGPDAGFVDRSEQQHPDLPKGDVFADLRANMMFLPSPEAEVAATAKSILGWQRSHRFCAVCGQESVMAQAGWRRDCPSCGGHHFPRTDPVVIMLVTYGNSVLLGRSPGWPEGMYSLLAGFVEPGETLETAVRREVAEETGVPVGKVTYLASQPWPFPSSLMVGCAAEALDQTLTLDPLEIEDALWMTREDLLSVFAGAHPDVRPVRVGAIAGVLLENWLADRGASGD